LSLISVTNRLKEDSYGMTQSSIYRKSGIAYHPDYIMDCCPKMGVFLLEYIWGMKWTLCFVTLLVIGLSAYAQKQGNIWYFGDHAGLDFNSGSPIPLIDGQTLSPDSFSRVIEGTAVISDSAGSLLFYSNGTKVWNKNHQVMPHGDSLLGNFSSTQSALIVAAPGSSRYFYVFTTSDFNYQDLQYGFRYSIVDICLDGGLGDVIQGQKNVLILDTVAEKLTAVRHSNGVDYWIIVHKYYSRDFYAYRLSSTGIIDTVISTVGSRHPLPSNPNITAYAIGCMKASPNGQKLCCVSTNGQCLAEYFDFNKSTGIVSNWVNIQTNTIYNYYGVAFSPDNSKLYIAGDLNDYNIYQYNLNAGSGNADSVMASRTGIAIQNYNYFGLQLATNGKIYASRGYPNQFLSVINSPNNLGLSCNYIDTAVYLSGKKTSYGLPNFIDSYDYSNTQYDCPAFVEEIFCVNSVSIYPNPLNSNSQLTFTHSPLNHPADIIINNIDGREVGRYHVQVGSTSEKIKLPKMAKGVYVARLVGEGVGGVDGNADGYRTSVKFVVD
jgi:hypothetical protein